MIGLVPSRLHQRAPEPLDAVAPWLLALDTTYACWNGAGLESGAFALVLALSMACARAGATPLGFLPLLRPEGPLYVAALSLLRGRRLLQPRYIAAATLPLIAWLLFRRGYYGQWLPNAYYAKHGWDYGGIRYLREWFDDARWHWALLASPIALLLPRLRRTALAATLACLPAVAFILISRGDWMSEHRFVAHALPAVALLAAQAPLLLPRARWAPALVLLAVAALDARAHAPSRKRDPPLPLSFVEEQGRWFRDTSARLGLTHPRIAHFDLGGVALESGGEPIDLAGLADLYIGRAGYQDQGRVRDYILGAIRPELINLHGPCAYIGADPRFGRDYALAATGIWGGNYIRRDLLAGGDARCAGGVESVRALTNEALMARLGALPPDAARDLWLCARAHRTALPDVRALARSFEAQGALETAVTLDPTLTAAAQRLLAQRLGR